jgi:hypothetical protein
VMFCIYCGTGNPDDAVFCRSCGRQQPQHAETNATASDNATGATSSVALSSLSSVPEPTSPAAPALINMSATESSVSSCPRCSQVDMSQSASSVVRAGISTTAYGGSSSGLGYIQGQGLVVTHGSHSGSAVNQTELSKRLALPDPPKYSNPYLWMFALLFIPVCALFALGPVGVILAALIWIGIGVGIYMWASNEAPKRKAVFDAAMSQYNTAKGKWEQLSYCHRDDIIYLPDGTYDHPNNMWSFLNS